MMKVVEKMLLEAFLRLMGAPDLAGDRARQSAFGMANIDPAMAENVEAAFVSTAMDAHNPHIWQPNAGAKPTFTKADAEREATIFAKAYAARFPRWTEKSWMEPE